MSIRFSAVQICVHQCFHPREHCFKLEAGEDEEEEKKKKRVEGK